MIENISLKHYEHLGYRHIYQSGNLDVSTMENTIYTGNNAKLNAFGVDFD